MSFGEDLTATTTTTTTSTTNNSNSNSQTNNQNQSQSQCCAAGVKRPLLPTLQLDPEESLHYSKRHSSPSKRHNPDTETETDTDIVMDVEDKSAMELDPVVQDGGEEKQQQQEEQVSSSTSSTSPIPPSSQNNKTSPPPPPPPPPPPSYPSLPIGIQTTTTTTISSSLSTNNNNNNLSSSSSSNNDPKLITDVDDDVPPPPPTPESHLAILLPQRDRKLIVGEKWFLISKEWWRGWDKECKKGQKRINRVRERQKVEREGKEREQANRLLEEGGETKVEGEEEPKEVPTTNTTAQEQEQDSLLDPSKFFKIPPIDNLSPSYISSTGDLTRPVTEIILPPPPGPWDDLEGSKDNKDKEDKKKVKKDKVKKMVNGDGNALEEKEESDVSSSDNDGGEDEGDAVMIHEQGWKMMVAWYGLQGPAISRKVIGGSRPGQERVEINLPKIRIHSIVASSSSTTTTTTTTTNNNNNNDSSPNSNNFNAMTNNVDNTTTSGVTGVGEEGKQQEETETSINAQEQPPITVTISSAETIGKLKTIARDVFQIPSGKQLRIWRFNGHLDESDGDGDGDAKGEIKKLILGTEEVKKLGGGLVKDWERDATTIEEAMLNEPNLHLAFEFPSPPNNTYPMGDDPSKSKPRTRGNLFGSTPGFFNTMSMSRGKVPSSGTDSGRTSPGGGFLGPLTRGRLGRDEGGTLRTAGLCGLSNLGNTCFMNSALQCMSNTPEIKDYFQAGVYRDELNRDNPLGMHGKVAEAFGELMERMWAPSSSSNNSVTPREFKAVVSRFQPQFAGWGQQDSQELLLFLLDGLHEDLNRIKKKPYVEDPDWEGGGDEKLLELGEKSWSNYKLRNDSVVVDLFQGQYLSTLVCPDCGKVAKRFDPFMYLSCPLPDRRKWRGTFYFVPMDVSKPRTSVEMELPPDATIKEAKETIGRFLDYNSKKMIAMEDYNHQFFRQWADFDSVNEINPAQDTVIVFEVPFEYEQLKYRRFPSSDAEREEDSNKISIAVFHTNKDMKKIAEEEASSSRFSHFGRPFGGRPRDLLVAHPFLLSLTREEACDLGGIRRELTKQYSRFSRKGSEMFEEPKEEDEHEVEEVTPLTTENGYGSSQASDSMEVEGTESLTKTKLKRKNERQPLVDLFKIGVSKRPDHDIPYQANNINFETIPLEERAEEARSEPPKEQNLKPRPPVLPGGFTDVDDDDDLASRYADVQPNGYQSTEKPNDENVTVQDRGQTFVRTNIPIVKRGDYFLIEWDAETWDYFFNEKQTLWEQLEAFVDPALKEKGSKRTEKLTVHDCLDAFCTKDEKLSPDDAWYCPSCKEHKEATKTIDLWKVPDIFVLHLKRFQNIRRFRDKIETDVDFPFELDLTDRVEEPQVLKRVAPDTMPQEERSLIYDLYAVDNHFGGLGGGHYTAYCKNPEDGKWYNYDDSRISPVRDPESVKTSAAYLLFYRRRTSRPIGAKSRDLVQSALQSRAASEAGSRSQSVVPFASGSDNKLNGQQEEDTLSSSLTSDEDSSGSSSWSTRRRGPRFYSRPVRRRSNSPYSDSSDGMDEMPRPIIIGPNSSTDQINSFGLHSTYAPSVGGFGAYSHEEKNRNTVLGWEWANQDNRELHQDWPVSDGLEEVTLGGPPQHEEVVTVTPDEPEEDSAS